MQCSSITTHEYSTSFSSAIRLLDKDLREHICSVYGFVRFADEIVDTFHNYDKHCLLAEFKTETYTAIQRGISINPILNSFQLTVNKYQISRELIDAFFKSMEYDLEKTSYDTYAYQNYIYGSAEVVGLMCLYVFCEGDEQLYTRLTPYARSLGAGFQKVNFLRDFKNDFEGLNRMYFPGCDFANFSAKDKQMIEEDIKRDFDNAYVGIIQLPVKVRFGVYVAYKYYLSLFAKIRRSAPQKILNQRIRIPDYGKMLILAKAGVRQQFNML
jgi:phytoene/squalene synthetase